MVTATTVAAALTVVASSESSVVAVPVMSGSTVVVPVAASAAVSAGMLVIALPAVWKTPLAPALAVVSEVLRQLPEIVLLLLMPALVIQKQTDALTHSFSLTLEKLPVIAPLFE